jgi:hypothetical protein
VKRLPHQKGEAMITSFFRRTTGLALATNPPTLTPWAPVG